MRKIPKIFIYNSLVEHSEIYGMSLTVDEFENNQERFEDFLHDNFNCDDDGFYEYDGDIGNNVYQIQIDDEEDGWEKRFEINVSKIKKFFDEEILLTKIIDFEF